MKEHLRRAKIKHYHNTHERQITRGDEYVAADKSFGVWIEIKNGGTPMNEHKERQRYRFMHSMDCIIYIIECSCGKECGGWTPQDAEKDFETHAKGDAK